MGDTGKIGRRPDPRRRDERAGIDYLLGEVGRLRDRGLIAPDASEAIVREYSARRETLVRLDRFDEAIAKSLAAVGLAEALDWAGRAREFAPERPDGWTLAVDHLRRSGRSDEADRLAAEAYARFPDLAPRPNEVEPAPASRPSSSSKAARHVTFLDEGVILPAKTVGGPSPSAPRISWSGVAGEFLEDHWQKLISGLAVLLIVVSSTIGASLVLGPLLWSPAGKGVLALLFTAACAGFGAGLVRWGAGRAGRVMLATSLIVVPVNFMLLGGLGLLAGGVPTVEIGLVALDAALLLALARWVVGSLGLDRARGFTAAFFGLAAFNAGAGPGIEGGLGLAVFLAPAVVFLGAVAWLVRGIVKAGDTEGPGRVYLQFGLLSFAFLASVARTGASVLHLGPSLYAVPTMLAAIATVAMGRAIGPVEKDRRVGLLFQQAGVTLSALAFALALARPPGPSALFSGNTLAVAVLGLALYASSLRATRLPAYLYCGFAALVVAYFGAFYFASDLVRSVEESARRALGYDRKLPFPFKSINGLAFNLGLAWLSNFFARRWDDERLARHCHRIGLPVSVAACVLAAFEPKAAVLCLGGYAVLYAAGARAFAEPRLVYLACASAAGLVFFAGTLAGWTGPGPRSVAASGLGLICWGIGATPWLGRAGGAYRSPLIRSSWGLAAVAIGAALLSAEVAGGRVGPLATLAFLGVAAFGLLEGRARPRVSTFLVAIGAMLGGWLGVDHGGPGGVGMTAEAHALAVASFAVALLLGAEVAREALWRSGAVASFVGAVGWAVPVVVGLAWSLAAWAGVDSVPVARSVLVGSVALVWLTRFRREPVLVDLGLLGLAAWAACLCGLVVPWDRAGLVLGREAITAAGCSLAIWGAGEWGRRRGGGFYPLPCFRVAGALAIGASALAVGARCLEPEAAPMGVAALAVGAGVLGLLAGSTALPGLVGCSAGAAVGAATLGVLGPAASWPIASGGLAVAWAVGSMACRGAGAVIRRASGEPRSAMARPLDDWAVVLVAAAAAVGHRSPGGLVAVAVAFPLLIGCFPTNAWLYGTFAALGGAAYQAGWLVGIRGERLIPSSVAGAYLAWAVGLGMQRFSRRWLGRLGLPDLALHEPPARAAVAFGVLAAALRLGEMTEVGGWADRPWLPWALAGLSLLMLRLDPSRGWVHSAAGLTGLGSAASLANWPGASGWGLSASMALPIAWRLASSGWGTIEARRGPVGGGGGPGVFLAWARAGFLAAGLSLLGIVGAATFAPEVGQVAGWGDGLLGLGLAACYLILEGRGLGRGGMILGMEGLGVLAAWWLVGPGSPVGRGPGIDRDAYLALVTAASAVGIARLALGATDPPESVRPGLLREATAWGVFGLGLAVAYFSAWAGGGAAVVALLLASVALGSLAIGRDRVEGAALGGVLWCSAWPVGLALAAGWSRGRGLEVSGPVVPIGLTSGLFGLWWGAGRVGRRVASAWEWVAIGAAVVSALLCLDDGEGLRRAGPGVLLALGAFFVLVARRRGEAWPGYAAQVLLLLCYLRGRPLVSSSPWADSVALPLLAYLDLGVSEVLARLRSPEHARSTLRFSLALPLVAIGEGIWRGRWDESGLFVLLATAAFYALAAVRMRSKGPAYAAGVLFNAFLWLAWSRLGWRAAEAPQFYLIPVGASAILLAEVNRKELGRSVVNALRNLGLVVIYASLVVPIWTAQSFGAWLALMILSLAGVFVGIGLRVQTFLWLGLACFVMDLVYQLARVGVDHPLARWAVMLGLGVALILFVALNEKKRIVATIRGYYDEARGWE